MPEPSKRAIATLCNFVRFRESIRQRIAKVFEIDGDDTASARQAVADLGASPIKWADDFRSMVRETYGVDLDEQLTLTWFAGAVAAAHFVEEGEREAEISLASSRLMKTVIDKTERRTGAPFLPRDWFEGYRKQYLQQAAADAR